MIIGSVPFYFRILDFLLIPVMWVFSGFSLEFLQESHLWHIQNVDCDSLDVNKGVKVMGDDESKLDSRSLFMHAPLFGGWRNYIVLKVEDFNDYWYVGWKVEFLKNTRQDFCQIQKLRIRSPYIKVLTGIPDSQKIFFAFDKRGEYIDLMVVGKGVLGDGKFRSVRLF